MNRLLLALTTFTLAIAMDADARAQEGIPAEITTPHHIQSKLGELDFKDGYPTQETANKIRDELDYLHGVEAFMNSIQGAKLNAVGSTTIYFAPKQPEGVDRGNWIQTDPAKGWFVILRLYSPLQAFFDKSWRPSEIELVQ